GRDDSRLHEAMDLIAESVAVCRAHPHQRILLASVLRTQAACFRLHGDAEKAIDSYQEASEIFQADDLTDEPRGHRITQELAETHFVKGQFQQAHRLLEQLEELCREHQATVSLVECLTLRGWGFCIAEDYAAAEYYLRNAVEIAEKNKSEYPTNTRSFANFHLARVLVELERNSDAQVHLQRILEQTTGFTKDVVADEITLYGHAWTLAHQDSSTKAELESAIEFAERGLEQSSLRQHSWQEPHFHLVIAIAQHKLGRVDSAINSLQRGIKKCRQPFPSLRASRESIPTSRRELEVTLARLLAGQNKVEDAVKVLEHGVDVRKEQFSSEHLQVVLAELRLGKFLRMQNGMSDRADQLIETAKKKLSEIYDFEPVERDADKTTLAPLD
ncbi:tetratricopeptide repeat protein, partial [Planctomycetota bacterium]